MKEFVLGPEIYLAGTMTGGGPAAELFRLAYSLKGSVVFVLSPWVKAQIVVGMLEAGYDVKTAEEQVSFIVQLHKFVDIPETEEDPLVELVAEEGLRIFFSRLSHSLGLATALSHGPCVPGRAVVGILQGHEEGIIVQPGLIFDTKCLVFLDQFRFGSGEKGIGHLAQERQLPAVEHPEIDQLPGELRRLF